MKKLISLFAVCLGPIFAGSEDLDETFHLTSKIDIDAGGSYYCLSDGSLWRVYDFNPRWRSLSEWWNDVCLVPEDFKCKTRDWFLGSEIQVISKQDAHQVCLEDAENQKVLKNCTHLLYNLPAGKYLFAVHLEPKDCLVYLYQDAFEIGHKKGYAEAKLEGNRESAKEFKKGYEAGYFKGFNDGKAKKN